MSQHQAVHLFLSPIRMLCLGGVFDSMCSMDSIDPDTGYPPFVSLGLGIVAYCEEQNMLVQLLLYLLYLMTFGPMYMLEKLVGASHAPVVIVLATVVYRRKNQRLKLKMA